MSESMNESHETADATHRTVAITGAGGNVGPAVAKAFDRAGWRLALLDSGNNVRTLREAFPHAVIATADLTDMEATRRAVREAEDTAGTIEAAVHLAGGFATGSALDTDDELFDRLHAANVRTLRTFVQAVLPRMLERGRGAIAGVGARQALEGGGNATAYASAKGGVLGYLRSLRKEVEPRGVGVTSIVPMGTIDTAENREAMPDADPAGWISPDELAATLVFFAQRGPQGRIGEFRLEAVPVQESTKG